jgi:hypothetical protein
MCACVRARARACARAWGAMRACVHASPDRSKFSLLTCHRLEDGGMLLACSSFSAESMIVSACGSGVVVVLTQPC